MNTKLKKYTQEDFAKFLGIDQPRASRLLRGIDTVGAKLAITLSVLCDEKTASQWSEATSEDLCKLYERERSKVEVVTA